MAKRPLQNPDSLTLKEEMFLLEYIKDMNATRAYIAAGFSGNTASSASYQVLRRPQVLKRLKEIIKERAETLQVENAYIIQKLITVCDKCLEVDKSGEFKRPSLIDRGLKALEMLMKHKGMLECVNLKEEIDETKKIQVQFIK